MRVRKQVFASKFAPADTGAPFDCGSQLAGEGATEGAPDLSSELKLRQQAASHMNRGAAQTVLSLKSDSRQLLPPIESRRVFTVGGSLLATAPVQPAHLHRLIKRYRQQAGSQRIEAQHRLSLASSQLLAPTGLRRSTNCGSWLASDLARSGSRLGATPQSLLRKSGRTTCRPFRSSASATPTPCCNRPGMPGCRSTRWRCLHLRCGRWCGT